MKTKFSNFFFLLFIFILCARTFGQELFEYKFANFKAGDVDKIENFFSNDTLICFFKQYQDHFELNLIPNMDSSSCYMEYARRSNKYVKIGNRKILVFFEWDILFTPIYCRKDRDVFSNSNRRLIIKLTGNSDRYPMDYEILW